MIITELCWQGDKIIAGGAQDWMVEVERDSRETKFWQGGTDTWGVVCTYGRRGTGNAEGCC